MAGNFLFHKMARLSEKLKESDEAWTYTEEPHSARRREILRKHPEIKKLMGFDPQITYVVTAEIIAQLFMCWLVQDKSWGQIFVLAYVIGGTLNHSLGSAIHEIGHNLAYGHKYPLWNRALGMLCNLPMGIPYSVTYKRFHSDHHRYLGHEYKDVDIPSVLEAKLFQHWSTRIIWLILHPLIHAIRPYYKSPKSPGPLETINLTTQFTFDLFIYVTFGWRSLAYLIMGTLLGLGCHPLAGHFLSEHYLYNKNEGQATHSYYGPLNLVLFNVGYHIEHHDFPYVPYNKLPEIKRLAPEYYDDLPYHTSWVKVLWDFVFDPELGPQSRGVGYREEDAEAARALHKQETAAEALLVSSSRGTVHDGTMSGMLESGCMDEYHLGADALESNGHVIEPTNHHANEHTQSNGVFKSKAV